MAEPSTPPDAVPGNDADAHARPAVWTRYWASGDFNAYTTPQEFLNHPENQQTARLAVFEALALVKENPHH